MKQMMDVYRESLKLYPERFRAEFGEEMELAFSDAVSEAAQGGRTSLIQLVLHELAHWPGTFLREHWAEAQRRRKEMHMTEMVSSLAGGGGMSGNVPRSGSWRNTWRAGFPHLLVMGLAAVSMFLQNAPFLADEHGPGMFISGTLVVLFWIVLLGALGRSLWTAHKEGWPDWTASWYGYLFVALVSPLIIILQDSAFATSRGLDQVYFFTVIPLALVGLLYGLVRKDRMKTLLVITPFAILLWMPVLEFVPTPIRNPLTLWMITMVAGVSMGIVRVGSWRKGMWLILGGSVLVGLPIAYAQTFHAVFPDFHIDISTPLEMANLFLTTLFWSFSLIFGPMMLGVLRLAGPQMGNVGRRGTRILLAGLALNLVGSIFLLQTRLGRSVMMAWQMPLSILLVVGFFVMVWGSFELARGSLSSEAPDRRVPWLSLLALGFPLTWLFPLMYTQQWVIYFSPLPVGFFLKYQIPESWPYGIGVVWLLGIGWMIAQKPINQTS